MENFYHIKNHVNSNINTVEIISTDDLITIWEKKTNKKISQIISESARFGANYISTIVDIQTVTTLVTDIGIKGKVILKTVAGKQYVIFKGYSGKRSIFTGTRYLASNPKVVDMAIGKIGMNKSIISGMRITIIFVVPLNVLNYILNDQQTMAELIGITATDLAKIGVASAVASLAATATASLTTLAAGPIVIAIAVGLGTGYALDALDQEFGVTDALVRAINENYNNVTNEIGGLINKVNQRIKWQIMNGKPVGKGIFY